MTVTRPEQFFSTSHAARQHIREVLAGTDHPEDAQDFYDLEALERRVLIGPLDYAVSTSRWALPADEKIREAASQYAIPAASKVTGLDVLRADLAPKKQAASIEDGTVLRFTVDYNSGSYTYAALRAADKWFTTAANGYALVKPVMTHDDFMDALRSSKVSKIEAATTFEALA